MEGLKVTKIFRDDYGRAYQWQLSDGSICDINKMTTLIDCGVLPGWMYSKNAGGYYIKTKPDGDKTNNMNYLH